MQTKGKKKIIDNAGALQKKYAWKSEKTQDTKKAPQDTKKQAAAGKTDLCAQKHWGLL